MAYGLGTHLMGSDVPHGLVHDVLFPRTPTSIALQMGLNYNGGMTEGIW
jgi:hypothetical protein